MANASKKKNTPVESLKRKKMEQGPPPREYKVKRGVRPKDRKNKLIRGLRIRRKVTSNRRWGRKKRQKRR